MFVIVPVTNDKAHLLLWITRKRGGCKYSGQAADVNKTVVLYKTVMSYMAKTIKLFSICNLNF